MELSHKKLKERHRKERDFYPNNLNLRVHRALSWLKRSEQCDEDDDARFIFLWIAFNAAYATDVNAKDRFSANGLHKHFLSKLCDLDEQQKLYELIWSEFSDSVRILLDNQYVFEPFWNYQRNNLAEDDWLLQFEKAKAAANKALARKNTAKVWSIVFNRLYTLRNQLMHGGATWNSSANRNQIRDGVKILGKVVPVIIDLMMDGSKTLWGDACYPVVK